MNTKPIQRLVAFLLVTIMMLVTSFSGSAASAQIFAVYRNGSIPSDYHGLVQGNDVWHAGFVKSTSSTDDDYIIHQLSSENGLSDSTLSGFLANNLHDRMGYYRPNTEIDDDHKILVYLTVIALLSHADIQYNKYYHVVAKSGTGSIINPADVYSFRCDGFVEYIYEIHEIRIYGADSKWNVSQNRIACKLEHSLLSITPKKQAQNHMVTLLGDVDVNQIVLSDDARSILRFSAHLDIPDEFQQWASDVDGDGTITASDARLVLQYSSHLITSFPAEP